MAVLLHDRLGLGLGTVGLVLAVASLVQFSGGVVGASVAQRIGVRRCMVFALAVRTAGFGLFLPGLDRPGVAVTALVLTCVGAALYLPANKAYLVVDVEEARRPLMLSVSAAALNAGVAAGPAVAGPFILSDPGAVFTLVTVMFAALTTGHLAFVPEPADQGVPAHRDGVHVLAGIAWVPFAITAVTLYLFMFFQHYLAVFAVERTSAGFYGLLVGGYALAVVIAQPLLADRIARMGYRRAVAVGLTGMTSGFAVIAVGTPVALSAGALLICVGEVVLFLRNDLEALARSARSPAVVFGQQRLAAGLGAFGSAVLGGQVYGFVERREDAGWFWLVVAAQGLVFTMLILVALANRSGVPARTRQEPGRV